MDHAASPRTKVVSFDVAIVFIGGTGKQLNRNSEARDNGNPCKSALATPTRHSGYHYKKNRDFPDSLRTTARYN